MKEMFENFQTVESWISEERIQAKKATLNDLGIAEDWLGQYETDDPETAQALANAMSFLASVIASKQKVQALNQAKREFAKANGIKFNQVRKVSKK